MTDEALTAESVFQDSVSGGDDKDTTILALVTRAGLSVTQALKEYQRMAREAGIVLGARERTEKIYEYLDTVDAADVIDKEKRTKIVNSLSEQYDVSNATIMQTIRNFCEENDIELPVVKRVDFDDVVKFAKDMLDDGKEKSDVIEAMQDEFGYTANTAASTFSRVAKELGIASERTIVDISKVVAFVRNNENTPRKVAVDKMVEELGYSESTANSYFTYLNFAKEYARQELAAQTEAQTEAA